MHRFSLIFLTILLLLISATQLTGAEEAMPMRLGGCGGLYLYAETGPLWVKIQKQDRNKYGRTTILQALLLGPDRKVLARGELADSPGKGKAGPIQTLRLETTVTTPGVYAVNITASNDRYGEDFYWGFTTNCAKYLVETSRGHKDERHQEPIVVQSPERSGEICFLPQPEAIRIEVTGLAEGLSELQLVDAAGKLRATLPVNADHTASGAIPAGGRDHTPWRLRLPKYQATLNLDGLTRWEKSFANLSLWTPDAASWFDFHGHRWLLTPYASTRYLQPGETTTVKLRLHNNADESKQGRLLIDRPGKKDPEELTFTLAGHEAQIIPVTWRLPEGLAQWEGRVRVCVESPAPYTTWVSVLLKAGQAPAAQPIKTPITLQPYAHENAQFGYAPDYPTENQVYFDLENRACATTSDSVMIAGEHGFEAVKEAVHATTGKRIPLEPLLTKIAFDQANDMYLIGKSAAGPVYLHSRDHGKSFTAWPIGASGSFDLEQSSGHNQPQGPPPFIRNIRTEVDPKLKWRCVNTLELFVPQKDAEGRITIGDPILVSRNSIGVSLHSGIPSTLVSRSGKTHLTWGEATPPEEKVPGVPTYVATYDHATGQLSAPALVGYGPPANDVHNTPCITMDSQGVLHVLIGTHGRTFLYTHSLAPDTAAEGWREAEPLDAGLRQTYVGLVCDKNDALHVVFRLWRDDPTYFPSGVYATLAYMRKTPGQPWGPVQPLVISAFSNYSVFYHRLTIDRLGSLFLSYTYWSTHWFYRMDHPGSRRALISSPDQGDSWRFVLDEMLVPNTPPQATQGG